MRDATSETLRQVSGCKNGACPKIFVMGARVAVQGSVDTELAPAEADARGQASVEVPAEIVTEAIDALNSARNIKPESSKSATAAYSLRYVDGQYIVRGDVSTDLTNQIEPGVREEVVEIPLAVLVAARQRMTVGAVT